MARKLARFLVSGTHLFRL